MLPGPAIAPEPTGEPFDGADMVVDRLLPKSFPSQGGKASRALEREIRDSLGLGQVEHTAGAVDSNLGVSWSPLSQRVRP